MSKIIGTEEKGGVVIISTEGYLNKDLAIAVMEEATKYIDNGTTNILINLSKSNIVNSIGASIIIELIEKLQEVNGSLSFCELPSIIEKTFKIMGLTKYCDTYENQEAALEQLI
jgi:anti-anti-sigma factor